MTTATTSYRPTARALHWIVALLVISTIPVGVAMTQEGLPRNIQDTLFIYHKNVGVIIFLLVLARLIFRAFNPAPPLPATMPGWQVNAAKASHALLYALLLVMTISGYVRVVAGDFPIEGLDALGVPRFIARVRTPCRDRLSHPLLRALSAGWLDPAPYRRGTSPCHRQAGRRILPHVALPAGR